MKTRHVDVFPECIQIQLLHPISSHLALSSADEHVHSVNLMHFELYLLVVLSAKKKKTMCQTLAPPRHRSEHQDVANLLLLVRRVLDDRFLAIDNVLLQLVGEHTCKRHKPRQIYFC